MAKRNEKSFEIVNVEGDKKTIFDAYMRNVEANYWWKNKWILKGSNVNIMN